MDSVLTFALLAALAWGLTPVFEKLGLSNFRMDPLLAVAVRSLAITVVSWVLVALSGRLPLLPSAEIRGVLLLMASGLVAGLLAQWLYFMALQAGEVSRVVTLGASYPLVALILAFVLFHEGVTWQKVLGTLLIVCGVTLIR